VLIATSALLSFPSGADETRLDRIRRLLRVVAKVLVASVVALTIASFAYNLVTNGRYKAPHQLYAGPFVRVDGTLLAYRRWGRAGTPIVLLGGAAEPSWVWHTVGPLLGRHHQVVALDVPPFGFSQRRGPYTLTHWVQLVDGFTRRLRLTQPLVVGHSLGAGLAVRYALDHPSATRGIVLLDGDAFPVGGPSWLGHLLLPPWYTSLYRIATSSDWIVRRVLRGAWPHADITPAVLEQFEAPFRVAGTDGAFRSLLGNGIQGVTRGDLEHVPTRRIVLWGADDSVDSVAAGRKTASILHARFELIPKVGHLSMLGNPRAVAAAIERFDER
jgi:pimeloyl-ACP methyl ester carboxylesterase